MARRFKRELEELRAKEALGRCQEIRNREATEKKT
jgi:hypothetical protein